MAYGGIFDHIEGGFSRYSTDEKWHIPHFEKMLYDNAQLMSLYSKGFKVSNKKHFKKVVYKIHEYINKEMKDNSGVFYSSLDADSKIDENNYIEGAYYSWSFSELKKLINKDFDLFSKYYNVNDYGYWKEEDKYVLINNVSDNEFISEHNLTEEVFNEKLSNWVSILKEAKKNKKKPNLDYKIVTSWNGLMISGYVDAYKAFNDEIFLNEAIESAEFIYKSLTKNDGGLFHNYVNGKSKVNGYLEDYATIIQASLDLYEITFNQKWIERALKLSEYVIKNFSNDESALFYFTSKKDEELITRTIEFRDNVIPSSNSIMAKNLFKLYHYFDIQEYFDLSKKMALSVTNEFEVYPSGYSNWFDLIYNLKSKFYEVAIVGKNAIDMATELNKKYLPNKLVVGSSTSNDLPLLQNRFINGKTLIYVCVNKACKIPTENLDESINMINF